MKRHAALALAGVLVAAGCGGDDTAPFSGEVVTVKDNSFSPETLEIEPGTTVRWVNEGRNDHDIVPVEQYSDFGVEKEDFAPGDTYEFTFDEPGVFEYWCTLHGTETDGMIGTVVVGDAEVDTETTVAGDGAAGAATTLNVPDDYPTIQSALDAATPGTLVLVEPGVYNEAVVVTKRDVVIRGLDRDETILDGEFTLENGFKVLADGVAIENITAQNYAENGFFWIGVTGYRGSYLTALRNGDYGIYAFDSVQGQFDHSYAAGSPDAGFYIGQCYPCAAVITDVVAEWNGLGYSGTNAGGDLLIVNSTWRHNRAGIVPNSGTGEKLYPEHDTTVVGNVVYANNNDETAAIEIAETLLGTGIVLAGGNENLVERNLVYDHDIAGIAIIPLPEKILNPDSSAAVNFDARDNVVRANVLRDNRAADLVLVATIDDATDAGGNCFADNDYTTSIPATIPECDETLAAFETDLAWFIELLGGAQPEGLDYRDVVLPDPGEQPEMPDARNAPARPASTGVPIAIDLDAIEVPTRESRNGSG